MADVFYFSRWHKLTFEDVMDPAGVQSDIDRRRMAQKAKKEEKDKAAKRDQMAEWLATYHQEIAGISGRKRTSKIRNQSKIGHPQNFHVQKAYGTIKKGNSVI